MTTPESLSLLLSYADAVEVFRGLRAVIIDELHALAGTKRATSWRWGWRG
jgi:ATP-dependent Lhr-like helicase